MNFSKFVGIILFLVFTTFNIEVCAREVKEYDYDFSYLRDDLAGLDDEDEAMQELLQQQDYQHLVMPQVQVALDDKATILLKAIKVTNNSLIPNQKLAHTWEKYLNKKVTFKDLYSIAKEITEEYQRQGYILSYAVIPAQTTKDGVVNIIVIEGKITTVDVTNYDPQQMHANILRYADRLTTTKPATRRQYSEFIVKANKLPGFVIQPKFVPVPQVLGEYKLQVTVKPKRFDIFVDSTNQFDPVYGDRRDGIFVRHNSLAAGFETSVYYTRSDVTSNKRMGFLRADHRHIVNSNGDNILLTYGNAQERPFYDDPLKDMLNPNGKGIKFEATYYRPLSQSWFSEVELFVYMTILNGKMFAMDTMVRKDHIRHVGLGLDIIDNESQLFSLPGRNNLTLTIEKGLDMFGAREPTFPATLTNPQGDVTNGRLLVQASRVQPLNTFGTFANFKLNGQYANKPMLLAKQFSYGGTHMGRGYYGSILQGDTGIAVQGELYHHWHLMHPVLHYIQFFASWDGAKVRYNGYIAPGLNRTDSATSAAVGTRFDLGDLLHCSVAWAKPLTHENVEASKESKIFFRIFMHA